MTHSCDVLVVGAGPAGSALALDLARDGFDVVLADRRAFPRQKPCGEFLSPQCRPYLRALGVDDALLRAGTRLVAGMRLHGHGHESLGRFAALPDLPYSSAGYAVRREVLDHQLLLAARARPEVRWLERHDFRALVRAADGRVTGAVLRQPDGTSRTVAAAHVVAADGVHSTVARQLGLQRQLRWLDRTALVARFTEVAAAPSAEVHFVRDGYFAATTVDDGSFHLNLVTDTRTLRARRGSVADHVAAAVAEAPVLARRLAAAHQLGPWAGTARLAWRTTRQVVPGAALVGDACGYLDPLTGEGIYFALFGARALAEALTEGRAEPRRAATALRRYQDRRRREVAPRLRLAALLQRALRWPFVVDHTLGFLAAHPAVCDLLVTMTGDCVHPRDLLRPSFWRRWHLARRSA